MAIEVFPVKKTILTADVLTLNGTPVTLIAAPGAGRAIILLDAVYFLDFNSAAYATNVNLQIQANGSNEVFYGSSTLDSTNDFFGRMTRVAGASNADQVVTNAAIEATVETGNPATGDSPITIFLSYVIIST